MSARPRIGITGPNRGGISAWWFTALAVRRAGGKPLRIRPCRPRSMEDLDALIIGGGADVSPDLYGQLPRPPLEALKDAGARGWRRLIGLVVFPFLYLVRRLLVTKTSGLNPDRDRLEKRLIAEAIERDRPLLGICRGMQLINVVAGGSLHQDLTGFYEEHPAIRSVLPRKRVDITPASCLARALGREQVRVNALHSQAIDRLGNGLAVSARERSGVVQAIEHTRCRFMIGVQWHPEYLPQRVEQQALFAHLIEAARQQR